MPAYFRKEVHMNLSQDSVLFKMGFEQGRAKGRKEVLESICKIYKASKYPEYLEEGIYEYLKAENMIGEI